MSNSHVLPLRVFFVLWVSSPLGIAQLMQGILMCLLQFNQLAQLSVIGIPKSKINDSRPNILAQKHWDDRSTPNLDFENKNLKIICSRISNVNLLLSCNIHSSTEIYFSYCSLIKFILSKGINNLSSFNYFPPTSPITKMPNYFNLSQFTIEIYSLSTCEHD